MIVRHHNQCRLPGAIQFLQQVHNVARRFGVEISRRLIAENERGLIRQRARDCHALAFAARQHIRQMIRAFFQTDEFQQFHRARVPFARVQRRFVHRHHHIFHRGQCRNQIVRLKNKTDRATAKRVNVAHMR